MEISLEKDDLMSMLDSIEDAVVKLDGDGKYVAMNRAAADVFRRLGKDPQGMIGKSVWELFPDVRYDRRAATWLGPEGSCGHQVRVSLFWRPASVRNTGVPLSSSSHSGLSGHHGPRTRCTTIGVRQHRGSPSLEIHPPWQSAHSLSKADG
jgi:hypothetical protein